MLNKLVSLGKVNATCFRPIYNYNLFGAPFEGLDPAKHIYMNKGLQNQYDDFFRLGDYPYVNDYAQMIDSQQYVPKIANLIETHLKQRYPNSQFNAKGYDVGDEWAATWVELGVNNFQAEVPAILLKLSEAVTVKESKWSWTKEQRYRLNATQIVMGPIDYTQLPTYLFVNDYNTLLWILARQSNNWTSPAIRGLKTPLEKQLEQDLAPKPKIHSLYRERPENQTFINKLLKAVHQ